MGNVSFVTPFGDDHQMKRLLAASCRRLGQESPRRYALPRSRVFGTSALVEAPFIGMVTDHRSCAPQRTSGQSNRQYCCCAHTVFESSRSAPLRPSTTTAKRFSSTSWCAAGQHEQLIRRGAGGPSAPPTGYVAGYSTNIHDCFSFSFLRILGCLLQSCATRCSGTFVCEEMASVLRNFQSVADLEPTFRTLLRQFRRIS